MAPKGKSAAILLGSLCAAVLAGGVLGFRTRIVEEWYLWKLRSGDPGERDRAALHLAAMPCLRAAEPILEAIRQDDLEVHITTMIAIKPTQALSLPPRAYALYQLGAAAVPAIDRAFKKDPPAHLFEIKDAILGKYWQVRLQPR